MDFNNWVLALVSGAFLSIIGYFLVKRDNQIDKIQEENKKGESGITIKLDEVLKGIHSVQIEVAEMKTKLANMEKAKDSHDKAIQSIQSILGKHSSDLSTLMEWKAQLEKK